MNGEALNEIRNAVSVLRDRNHDLEQQVVADARIFDTLMRLIDELCDAALDDSLRRSVRSAEDDARRRHPGFKGLRVVDGDAS